MVSDAVCWLLFILSTFMCHPHFGYFCRCVHKIAKDTSWKTSSLTVSLLGLFFPKFMLQTQSTWHILPSVWDFSSVVVMFRLSSVTYIFSCLSVDCIVLTACSYSNYDPSRERCDNERDMYQLELISCDVCTVGRIVCRIQYQFIGLGSTRNDSSHLSVKLFFANCHHVCKCELSWY